MPVVGMVSAAPEKPDVVRAVEEAVIPDWVLPAQIVAEPGVMLGTVGRGFTVTVTVAVPTKGQPVFRPVTV